MNNYFKDKKILITGGYGFLGQSLFKKLKKIANKKIILIGREEYDLVLDNEVKKMYIDHNPDIVFHLAASVGGIGINSSNPGKFFYENMLMNLNVIHNAYLHNVKKVVSAGSVSAYPESVSLPLKEKNLWDGYPKEINSSYGIAKRIIHSHSLSYEKQYKFKSILLLFTNLYGPNDNYKDESSHVIASLIKKFCIAKKKNYSFVEVWGNGKATRDFCYVDDAVNGLILAAIKYNKTNPLNIGSGKEVSIMKLVNIIKGILNYNGKIKWLTNKPTGIERRYVSIFQAKKEIGFKCKTSLIDGLVSSIKWYQKKEKLF